MTRSDLFRLPRLSPDLLWRLPFCALAVLACYQYHWMWLQFLTSEAVLRFAEWRGYTGERLTPDLIVWNGQRFEFGIACTFADVFCGALPLLWLRHAGILRNAVAIAAFAGALFAFNLLRQAATSVAFSAGVPWALADNAIGGLSYFAVWVVLVLRLERSTAITPLTAATASSVAS